MVRARQDSGLDSQIINQILLDQNFEENIIEAMEIVAANPLNPGSFPLREGDKSQDDQTAHTESELTDSTQSAESTGLTEQVESLIESVEEALSGPQFDRNSELSEATTSDFSDLVGDGSNVERTLIKSYNRADSNWRKIVSVVPLSNMKSMARHRRSDTDKYILTPQGSEVEMGSWSTYSVTYTPKKYERGASFSWEMLINDDLGAFRNIAVDLGIAARNTIANFVMGFIRDNSDIYDGLPLFDSDHDNIGADALSESSLSVALTAMRTQTSEKGATLAIVPGFLVVPPQLEFKARKILNSSLVPGASTNDINVLKGIVDVIVEPMLSDPDNWYLVAKPESVATIEIGFLAGRETPEIFMREDFDHDTVEFKGRLAFGGAVLDYRGFYGSLVE